MAVSGVSSANDLQHVHKVLERGADLVNNPNAVRSDAAILGMSSDVYHGPSVGSHISFEDAGQGAKYCSSPHAADLHRYSTPMMAPSHPRAPFVPHASGSTSPTPLTASSHIDFRVQPHQQQGMTYPKAHMLVVDSPSVKSALLASMMPQQPITPQHAGSAAFVPCSSYFEGTPSTDSSIVGDGVTPRSLNQPNRIHVHSSSTAMATEFTSNKRHISETISLQVLPSHSIPCMPPLPVLEMQPAFSTGQLMEDGDSAWHNAAIPEDRSTSGDPLDELLEAHSRYLTPKHLRKGRGGRQPAADPRHDPGIEPKKARRILANRLSAARSKMRQKTIVHVLQDLMSQTEELDAARGHALTDIRSLHAACEEAARQETALHHQLQVLQQQSAIQSAMFERMFAERESLMNGSLSAAKDSIASKTPI